MKNRFRHLDTLLLKYKPIWTFPAFKFSGLDHLNEYPRLRSWCESLTEKQVRQLQGDNELLLSEVSPYFPEAAQLAELIRFPLTSIDEDKTLPKFWDTGIPGRKAQQILAFHQALQVNQHPFVEWCCGKQHLGRLLSEQFHTSCLGLEIDTQLVRDANQLATKLSVYPETQARQCDVLSHAVDQHLLPEQHLVALHACGGLHKQLLLKAVQHRVNHLSFSPCCYHRFNDSDHYQALSRAALASPLKLTNDELRIAVRETKTSAKGEIAKRKQLQSWRLGFDSLQRECRSEDSYLEMPSISQTILQTDFKHFCQELAKIKNVSINANIDFSRHEENGALRFREFERAELVKMVFRRALETWLVLDRALYLEEQGYETRIELFCSSDISPRNFFINAKLLN